MQNKSAYSRKGLNDPSTVYVGVHLCSWQYGICQGDQTHSKKHANILNFSGEKMAKIRLFADCRNVWEIP